MSVTDLRNTGSVEEILEWCASLPPETENEANGLMKRMCDRWSLRVLGAIGPNGPVRFAALGRRLITITQKVLTRTLRSLEHDCLITRTVYPEVPPRVEYELTSSGKELLQAISPLFVWYVRHLELHGFIESNSDHSKDGRSLLVTPDRNKRSPRSVQKNAMPRPASLIR
jgi:DNA-binding HxlR family transcriptional regulator